MKNGRKEQKNFSLHRRGASFLHALRGIHLALRTQHNLWFHLAAIVAVLCTGFVLILSPTEWGLVVFAIGLVLTAEIFNTSIEFMVDWITPERDDQAKQVKDLAAGGVLLAAITAAVIGGLIFLPKIIPSV